MRMKTNQTKQKGRSPSLPMTEERFNVQKKKILYVASTQVHLERFHMPYIKALKEEFDVCLMANGENVDEPINFQKSFFSFSNLKAICKIRSVLKRERFDAVILHTSLAAFLVRMAMLGMRSRPFVLNVVHGYLFFEPARGLKDHLMRLCERINRRRTDEIAVMNAEDLAIACKYQLCRGNTHFLYGMGCRFPKDLPEPNEALRARYADEDSLLLTFVGELSGRKNQSFLIRSVARLRNEGVPIRLLLVGEGRERTALESEIAALGLEGAVFAIGSQSPVLPYLAITDLYVSASKSEGLPFNLLEAMACGLPILASECKGQTDLLNVTEGALYPTGDQDAFCAAVKRFYLEGKRGVGTVSYPQLERYALDRVLEENLRIMKGFAQ